jgi:hypothetical protein
MQMDQEEINEREQTTFFSLLNSAAWVLDDLVCCEDPVKNIEDNKVGIDNLLEGIATWLDSKSDEYVASLRKFAGQEAYIALWRKGEGLAIDVSYYCNRCIHQTDPTKPCSRRIPGHDIEECFERKPSTRDN